MFKKLEELQSQDAEFVKVLVSMFMEQGPELYEDVKKACSSSDSDKVIAASHSLKGVCMNLGFDDLASVCKSIEEQTRDGNISAACSLVNELDSKYEEVFSGLTKFQ